jgi:hypothetical protein
VCVEIEAVKAEMQNKGADFEKAKVKQEQDVKIRKDVSQGAGV